MLQGKNAKTRAPSGHARQDFVFEATAHEHTTILRFVAYSVGSELFVVWDSPGSFGAAGRMLVFPSPMTVYKVSLSQSDLTIGHYDR